MILADEAQDATRSRHSPNTPGPRCGCQSCSEPSTPPLRHKTGVVTTGDSGTVTRARSSAGGPEASVADQPVSSATRLSLRHASEHRKCQDDQPDTRQEQRDPDDDAEYRDLLGHGVFDVTVKERVELAAAFAASVLVARAGRRDFGGKQSRRFHSSICARSRPTLYRLEWCPSRIRKKR